MFNDEDTKLRVFFFKFNGVITKAKGQFIKSSTNFPFFFFNNSRIHFYSIIWTCIRRV
jgi:hypothetical protein